MILAMPALTIDQNNGRINTDGNTFILQRKSSRRLSSTRGFKSALSLPLKREEDDEIDVDDIEEISSPVSLDSDSITGWIRVYEGLNSDTDHSRVVYLTHCTTTRDVCR